MLGIAEGTCKAQLHRARAAAEGMAGPGGTHMNIAGGPGQKVHSLRRVPQIAPRRDLWPQIAAAAAAAPRLGGAGIARGQRDAAEADIAFVTGYRIHDAARAPPPGRMPARAALVPDPAYHSGREEHCCASNT